MRRWMAVFALLVVGQLVVGQDRRPPAGQRPPFRNHPAISLSSYGGCEIVPPTVTLTAPAQSAVIGGSSTTVTADASDPAPGSGVRRVLFYWSYCGASFATCGPNTLIGADSSSPYSFLWGPPFPSCASYPLDRFRVTAVSEDACNNPNSDARQSVAEIRLDGRGC